jgi:ATP-binding cassette subfamily B protein
MLEFGDNSQDDIKGAIKFVNVSFAYEKQDMLRDVSFSIKPQSFTTIVGKSGNGKSTIFRLLLRLYKVNKGTVLLDGVDIYDYSKEVYANNVSIVTQKPFIFDMSIRENLNLVDPNHENQVAACKRVGIHDYIMSLKDGYNTKLVHDGEDMSGGEKQLLAFARTLLSGAEVLLFDEVTATLDINTSKQVFKIMQDLKKDHTVLVITHNPELMRASDDILVVNKGKIVGKGSHTSLMRKNKYYQVLQNT